MASGRPGCQGDRPAQTQVRETKEAELFGVCVRFHTWGMGRREAQTLLPVRCWRLSHGGRGPEQNICKCKGPGRYPTFSGMKFHKECIQNQVWGPPGDRVMTNFVKHMFFAKDVLDENHG